MHTAPRQQRGAALLLALLILTLIVTLSVNMVWQQWRALQIETAERARTQSAWILGGALDWARLILREDEKNNQRDPADHLGEPWAVPLAEARLSSFLAADRNNNATDDADALDAFLSGVITDAQSRWNMRRLVDGKGEIRPEELAVLRRLCEAARLSVGVADQLAAAAVRAWAPKAPDTEPDSDNALVPPQRMSQWQWAGIDAKAIAALEPWVIILPDERAGLNVNTAPAEVIAAAVEGMSPGVARRLVQDRQREPLKALGSGNSLNYFTEKTKFDALTVISRYFIVQGRLRLDGQVLEERSLVERRQLEMFVLSRERVSSREQR